MTTEELNVLSYSNATDNFVFVYSDENRVRVLGMIASFATDPEVNLSWLEAEKLARRLRPAPPKSKPQTESGSVLEGG